MKKKVLALGLVLMMMLALLPGCDSAKAPAEAVAAADASPSPTEAPAEPVTIVVAGSWPDCRALDVVAAAFTKEYPNCTIEYEYLQDYYASLEKRMSGEKPVDLFFTVNIQADSPFLPYALDLIQAEGFELDDTFEGLIDNFMFREESGEKSKLYAIPLGAEMRGLYVNKTLLKSVGLDVPTDQAELLHCCAVLKENGYIPFHGNPGDFSQTLLYPWVCNLIANAPDPQAAYDIVNARDERMVELLQEPYAFLYTLVENGYYDYKRAQTELGLYTDTTEQAYANDFLNIRASGDTFAKVDDVGQVAFMPSPMSYKGTIDKTKEDHHSGIEYAFVMAPVGPDGGYAYMSPAHGIAANKASAHSEWNIRFLNFLFRPENNEAFAEAFNVVPNTKEAFSYISTLFDLPDGHVSQLGQVTFDYGFYDTITPSLRDLSKANNPKYMKDDGNGSVSLYPLEYYLAGLEEAIKAQ